MLLKAAGFFACSALFLFSQVAWGKTDYCKYSEESLDMHVFPNSYFLQSEKPKFEAGFNNLYEKLNDKSNVGMELNIIIHSDGTPKRWSKCVPGCPETTFLEGLTSDCSVEIAKKKKKVFTKQATSLVRSALTADALEYDVVSDMTAIQEFYKGRDENLDGAYIFHSTLPFGTSLNSKSSFDKAFVRSVQRHNLSTISMPSVRFVNANRSGNVAEFWRDLALQGHKSGLRFQFDHITLD